MPELIESWCSRIKEAAARRSPLNIHGGHSKDWYGGDIVGASFDTREHSGIVRYEPDELVLTARSGTPLREIEARMHEAGQMLAFEPPHFSPESTLGGAIATGLSGPRRVASGAARDFMLGVRLIDGKGDHLRFGGEVMKNVAGFDVARLQVGALGTLGVLTEVSLKCLPRPKAQVTLRFDLSAQQALDKFAAWSPQPLPITGSVWCDGQLSLRLAGAEAAVRSAFEQLGGEVEHATDVSWWADVRDQQLLFFHEKPAMPLWRLSVRPTAPFGDLGSEQFIEWNGALRWIRAPLDRAEVLRRWASDNGGHATVFRRPEGTPVANVFAPLTPALFKRHVNMKNAFDPYGVFNRGRLFGEF